METHLVFYDLKKAYDRVPREALWGVLKKIGVPPRMLRVIQELHEGMEARVDVEGQLSEIIEVKNGVRQGCCLAPLLFGIFESVVVAEWRRVAPQGLRMMSDNDGRLTRHAGSAKVWGTPLELRDCHFVDDAASLSQNRAEAEEVAKEYQRVAARWGQEMSISKTKYMCHGGDGQDIAVMLVEQDAAADSEVLILHLKSKQGVLSLNVVETLVDIARVEDV